MTDGVCIGMVILPFHHNDFIKSFSYFISAFSISDFVSVIGIIVNAYLAFWIVRKLQDKITNKRVLKDHFISEIKDLRVDFRFFLEELNKGETRPKEILSWFKLMNIKCTDVVKILHLKHDIPTEYLHPYTQDLKLLVTEMTVFKDNFNKNKKLKLDSFSKSKLVKFQQANNSVFNKLIIEINDHT